MTGNVLLIVIDQLRADCLTGALAETVNLPNLRKLMAESVTFNRHCTVATPCGPSRASLLTGLYAMNHRSVRNGVPLARDHATIGTEFRKAGYEPLLFGYTDVSPDPADRHPNDPDLKDYEGVAPGFAEIVRMRLDSNWSWAGYLKSKGYDLPKEYWDLFRPVPSEPSSQPRLSDPALYRAEDSDTAYLTDRTLQELSARVKDDWFSMVTYIRPHPPLVAPSPYNEMYAPEDVPLPVCPLSLDEHKAVHPYLNADYSAPSNRQLHAQFDGRTDNISEEDSRELRAVYLGLATEVDHHIGRILDFLRDTDQYEETLIVITADHGDMLGDHHVWGKHVPFEGSFHIPLIIRDPKNRAGAGTVVNSFTESIDLAPTLSDWVGEDANIAFNGRSLLPFLGGEQPDEWRSYTFAEVDFGDPVKSTRFQSKLGLTTAQSNFAILRDERFSYVHFNGGLPPLLYDLKADPHEGNNLAINPDYSSELLRLSRMMLDHRMTFAHHAKSRMKLTQTGVRIGRV
ncbi:MAG: alkaline phosphatase family protein [Rhizobiaceae bacterium]